MQEESQLRTSPTLLGRLREAPGDAAAWGEFEHRYGPLIFSWCRHWGLQPEDAQDVVQDVLLALVKQMPGFVYDPKRRFRGWLNRVAHGAWCDFLRARQRAGAGSGDSGVLDRLLSEAARVDLEQRLEQNFDRELLTLAAEEVRRHVQPQSWQAFELMEIQQLSAAEAGERLGMKPGAVFMAVSRVRERLRAEIRRLQGTEDSN
jgi:RNA polymerase sigma-70 factor (ECF subfamily)